MKTLKPLIIAILLGLFIASCASSPKNKTATQEEQPVVIANDSLEYKIIIIDIGFNSYLNTVAKPKGFYSQSYLENKNRMYVTIWNMRARNPSQYNPNIYENVIDYNHNIDYGYEVNYKLFNYFEFAQQKYRMQLR